MICDKSKCTGCFSCYNICPKFAINIEEDNHGFVYPEINKDKCVNCNFCKKACPSLNNAISNYPISCYAAFVKDKEKLRESTSGGMATIFSEYILENEGIVYGASFSKNRVVNHVRIDNKKDLKKIKGSKYTHSYINDTYKNVLQDLKQDKYVLFTGTPCQIAGLKQFLNKDYEKLICVDIICHGVPSQKYLKEELKDIKEIDNITFRSKEGFYIKAFSNEKEVYNKKMEDSPYYSGFLSSTFYRLNCYNCNYAKPERISDITIGDFWGLDKNSEIYNKSDNGISVVLIITKKGMKLFENIKQQIFYEERTVEEAIKGNTQLREPSKMKKDYHIFYKYYEKLGLKKAYEKSDKLRTIKRKIRYTLRDNKLIYNIYIKLRRQ